MNHFFWFQHQYDIIACAQLVRLVASSYPEISGDVEVPITNIIMRCECGGLKEKTVRGHFTLEELRGTND